MFGFGFFDLLDAFCNDGDLEKSSTPNPNSIYVPGGYNPLFFQQAPHVDQNAAGVSNDATNLFGGGG